MKKAFLHKVEHIDDYIDRAEALMQKYVLYFLCASAIYFLGVIIVTITQ
ncbi:MAG: hypothetical protein ABFD75_12415 [Smithella sp.]